MRKIYNKEGILFITHKLNVGGAAKMMKYTASIAQRCFSRVKIVGINDSECTTGDIPDSIQVITMNINPLPRVFWQLKAVYELRKLLKNDDSLYICTFVTQVAFITKVASLGLNKIIISAERGDPYTMSLLWKIIAKWVYRNSNYSFFQLPLARDFYGKKIASKSFVVPNPFITRGNVEPNFEQRNESIVSAGRFVAEKGFEILIKAFKEVHLKHPNYYLKIYGDGPLKGKYLKLVKNLGLEKYIIFPGYVEKFEMCVREEGIFVLSSFFEGIPNTLIEAMSVGTPCVATDCSPGGPSVLFENEQNGILIPVGDVVAMVIALNDLIESPLKRKELSHNAVRVKEILDESKIRKEWINVFNIIKNNENEC